MDFLDDDPRPRFLFQSHSTSAPTPTSSTNLNKLHASCCFSAALLLLTLSYLSSASYPISSSLLLWSSLSLLLAPFSPSHLTGGDISVGHGPPLPSPSPPTLPPDEPQKRNRRNRPPPDLSAPQPLPLKNPQDPAPITGPKPDAASDYSDEKEWTEEDFDLLKKQIVKHPVGAPKRWEKVAEAFKGRHGLESVIKTAKSLSERRAGENTDSFKQFLKQRKVIDKRVEGIDGDESGSGSVNESWSSAEDIALLNALKAFPKDVSMRWEKIAAAVPGKSKAACMKRISELKKDFRSSKASEL